MSDRWLLLSAVPTNHTIDDSGPLVRYSGDILQCTTCPEGPKGWDPSQLFNRTVTMFVDPISSAQFNFSGIALYVFFADAAPGDAGTVPPEPSTFFLDDVEVGTTFDGGISHSMGGGAIQRPGIQSNDPELTSSSDPTTMTPILSSFSRSTTSSLSETASSGATSISTPGKPTILLPAKKKVPVGAIAGGAVGGLVKSAPRGLDGGLISMETPGASSTHPTRSSGITSSERDGVGIVDQLRMLTEQVQRLEQRTAGSDAAPVGRSLSMLKREQTRVVQEYQGGNRVVDRYLPTATDLQLTAARVDTPPSYDYSP
ncbi:hypothetical protein B0H14DRAFT_3139189 [Mycena olivaceomarginata]|nr:hypothetical protein B0H14DRAFT_3139189 [Mycena olivaceomarginata]